MVMVVVVVLTCKLAISDRPALFHTIEAGGFASASHRNTSESLPSSRSICGAPCNRIVGGSIDFKHTKKREIDKRKTIESCDRKKRTLNE